MEKAEENLELITRYFADFSPEQLQQLRSLEELYKDWNSKINVISRKDEDSLYGKHILHSLSIAAAFNLTDGMNVLDLGTGGGFPGIPLAIFFPRVNFYLADSIGKKIKVVQAIADAIGLKNVSAHHIRVEEIKNKKFDAVVSRAVAPLGELWNWSKPLLHVNRQKGNVLGKMGEKPDPGKVLQAQEKGRAQEAESRKESILPVPNGLICLKGGDLATEISECGCRPRIMEISGIFNEPIFREKYILYVPLES